MSQRLEVAWYGGARLQAAVITGNGQRYKAGQGSAPVCRVLVEDLTGTHRAEGFFTTVIQLTPRQIIEEDTARMGDRSHFGGSPNMIYWRRPAARSARPKHPGGGVVEQLAEVRRQPVVVWTGTAKRTLNFSDAITLVRREIWRRWILASPQQATVVQKLNPREKHAIIELITHAM